MLGHQIRLASTTTLNILENTNKLNDRQLDAQSSICRNTTPFHRL